MKRITKPPEIRRQELLDTAMELFTNQGYEETSMGDIARAAGVAQGLGDGLLEYASERGAEGGAGLGAGGAGRAGDASGMTVVDSSSFGLDFEPNTNLTDIRVTVDGRSAAIAFGAGFALVAAAVACSSAPLLRRTPKEILGKMS